MQRLLNIKSKAAVKLDAIHLQEIGNNCGFHFNIPSGIYKSQKDCRIDGLQWINEGSNLLPRRGHVKTHRLTYYSAINQSIKKAIFDKLDTTETTISYSGTLSDDIETTKRMRPSTLDEVADELSAGGKVGEVDRKIFINNESDMNSEEIIRGTPSRTATISWDDYFMGFAVLSAKMSKDNITQVGACIVNADNKIVGVGYNTMPNGCDDKLPWKHNDKDPLNNKYLYICHAELNAVLNKYSADLKDCRIYITLFPCNDCAKVIIQAGIRSVVYLSDDYGVESYTRAPSAMFEHSGVKIRQHVPSQSIILDFKK